MVNDSSDVILHLIRFIGAFMSLLLAYLSIIPPQLGWVFFLIGVTSNLLKAFTNPDLSLDKYFSNFSFALSPIWVLFIDPCSLASALTLTSLNIIVTSVEQHQNLQKFGFTALIVASWAIIYFASENALLNCSETISGRLKKDILGIIFWSLLIVYSLSARIDAYVKTIQDTLTQVKHVNAKFEEINNQLKELLNEKDNFILVFSHETRNPLNILLGNIALLLEETESVRTKDKLFRCKFCADLLLQNLNNILDSGKLATKGTLEVTPTRTQLYEYLQSISSFMEMLTKRKSSLDSLLMIPQQLPYCLKFDMQRLTQVIFNLLTNAVKFTDSGSISMIVRYLKKAEIQESDYYPTTSFGYKLLSNPLGGVQEKEVEFRLLSNPLGSLQENEVEFLEFSENPLGSAVFCKEQFQRDINSLDSKKRSFAEEVQGQGFLKIEVMDTGCGLQPDDVSKLFKKFSQTHAEGAQRQIGSGLGLWITKNLCELMGGGIHVYSKPKTGTCFTVLIRADSLPSTPQIAVGESKLSNKAFIDAKRKVLIADDDPYNLEIHSQIVKKFGYSTVDFASNGKELIKLFKAKPEGYYDLVISDVNMPQIDGIEAAKTIRELETKLRRDRKVRIGFLTGHSIPQEKAKCESYPICAIFYLVKPIKPIILEEFLQPGHRANKDPGSISFDEIRTQKPLILCIDDNQANLECMAEMLRGLGVNTLLANSGDKGIAILKTLVTEGTQTVSLIFIDCQMAATNSWTASQKIKAIFHSQKKRLTPIIGLTVDVSQKNTEKFKNSGMDDLIQKPISIEKLQNLLKKYN